MQCSGYLTLARLSGLRFPRSNHSTYSLPNVPRFIALSLPRSTVSVATVGRSRRICRPSCVLERDSCRAGRNEPAVDSERVAIKSAAMSYIKDSQTVLTAPLGVHDTDHTTSYSKQCILNRIERNMPFIVDGRSLTTL